MDENRIFIINYEALGTKKVKALLMKWRPEVVLCDESQRIKGNRSKRTLNAIDLGDGAIYRYILTGTPLLNKPLDIWAQYRFLDKGESFGENFYAFRNKYFYDKNAGMPSHKHFPDWKPLPFLEEEFNRLIYKKAMRVLKKDCLDLPTFVRQKVYAEMGKEQMRMYIEMKNQLITYLKDKACVARIALTKALRLQQIVSGFFVDDDGGITIYKDNPRLDIMNDQILDLIDAGHKVIVWACFRQNYKMIEQRLATQKGREDRKINSVFLIGGMSEKERQDAVKSFCTDPACQVLIANQGAAGVGINLIEASYSLYYSKNFKLEDDLQSEARNYRGGSEVHEKVTRIDIVCRGSIDDKINQALASKQNMAEKILDIRL